MGEHWLSCLGTTHDPLWLETCQKLESAGTQCHCPQCLTKIRSQMPSGEKLYGQMGQKIELVGHNDERYYYSSKDEAKVNSVTMSSMVVVASCSWDVVLLEASG